MTSPTPIPVPESRLVLTYSALRAFQACRRKFQLRYLAQLVPNSDKTKTLAFGTIIHECLEIFNRGAVAHEQKSMEYRASQISSILDAAYPRREVDPDERADHHLATAMLRAYANAHHYTQFRQGFFEREFMGDIINPDTGAPSKTAVFAGKIDGIVLMDDGWWILEYKTASQITNDYLERLWTDWQIGLYVIYARRVLKIPVIGVLYDVLVKSRINQSQGETEDEYQQRLADLTAKSKTGKPSQAKRKMPETDEEFQARLAEKYAEPGMIVREKMYIEDALPAIERELWGLTQEYLWRRRQGSFYPSNRTACHEYGRPCPYWQLCSNNMDPTVRASMYHTEAPHSELSIVPMAQQIETAPAETATDYDPEQWVRELETAANGSNGAM